MKRVAGFLMAAALLLLFQAPAAHAQYSGMPNQAAWNQYLSNHPDVANQLRTNPSLIYNRKFRDQHEHLKDWLGKHPNDWKAMQEHASWQNQYGAWDHKNGEWHDQNWWYHHNPQWAHENHPDWWQQNKDWQWKQQEHAEHAEQAHQQYNHHHHHHHDHDHDND